jgi:hypothetical protein
MEIQITPITYAGLLKATHHYLRTHDMDKLTFSTQLANQILSYLGSRPYQEVFQLIDAIQAEAKNQAPKVEE